MTRYVCWKDGTDLSQAVLGQREGDAADNVVVLSLDTSDEDLREETGRTPSSRPLVLQVDPELLRDDRASELAQRAVAIAGEGSRGDTSPGPSTDAWSVVVTCPNDECENSFTSETRGTSNRRGELVVIGRPPSNRERYLAEASKDLGPDKSLNRASEAAKYVIANITLVAAVVGGFGIFSDSRGSFSDYPALFGGIVAAAALAIVCAVVALLPKVERNFNHDDLLAVESSYAAAIRHRAGWTKAAMGFLLAAIALGSVVFFLPRYAHPSASVTAGWDGSGARLVLDATAKASGLPEDSLVVVVVRGVENGAETALLRQRTSGEDDGGSASLALKLPHLPRFESYRIETTLLWDRDDGDFQERSVEELSLTVPPFDPPPAAASE